jgi:hypothetical protein
MRNLMIFAAVMMALGSFMAQMADRIAPASAAPGPAKTAPTVSERRPRLWLSLPFTPLRPHSLRQGG